MPLLVAAIIAVLCWPNTVKKLCPAKRQEPNAGSEYNRQKDPSIEGHYGKHQQIGDADLNHLKYRLDDMDEQRQFWFPEEYRSPEITER